MASDWKSITLHDVATLRNGAGVKQAFFTEELDGVPLIKVSNFTDDSISIAGLTKVDSTHAQQWESHFIETGDVLIATVGSWPPNWSSVVGKVVKAPIESSGAIQNQNTCCIQPSKIVDKKFLYYKLKNRDFLLWVSNVAQGSANQARIPVKQLGKYNFKLPPLPEQKAIAHILGSLDDKIELNRQMNETLEAMAQALFKGWFVDFDPVIDNALAAGKPIPDEFIERAELRKGIEKKDHSDIQNLFPDEFEFTEEMGWIPKEWQELQIKDIAKVVKGKSYKSSELAESQTALVTLKSFKRGGGYRLDGLKEYTGKYKEEQEVKAGDLVIAYTDVTQAADLIGKPAMVIDDIRYKHLVISLDVAVVRPEIDSQKYYLYGLAQTEAFQSHNYSHSTGTTVLHLSKNAVPDYYLCLPSENLLHGFTKIVEPLFTSVNNNIGEIRNFEKLRDTLLPKLMSGELRIADAAAMVEEA